jgi:hypothetical protein
MTTEQTRSEVASCNANDADLAAAWHALLNSPPLPKIMQSIEAFRRDLPELLRTHPDRWVAYSGDERLGFGKTETGLYQRYFQRGLTQDDLIVAFIEPGAFDPDEEFEVTYEDV